MKVQYHPAVEQDVVEVLRYYDNISAELAEDFKAELQRVISLASSYPRRCHPIKSGIRRANLRRFPYHLVYYEIVGGIRVTLVRHHRRDPKFGIDRV